MYTFHTTVYVRPDSAAPGVAISLGGLEVATLQTTQATLVEPFPVSFEEATDRLNALPRMFCEPDGALVWTTDQGWQVDGTLYDRQGRLWYLELKGSCSPEAFDTLLAAVVPAELPLVFQLAREGVLLDAAEFRRVATHQAG